MRQRCSRDAGELRPEVWAICSKSSPTRPPPRFGASPLKLSPCETCPPPPSPAQSTPPDRVGAAGGVSACAAASSSSYEAGHARSSNLAPPSRPPSSAARGSDSLHPESQPQDSMMPAGGHDASGAARQAAELRLRQPVPDGVLLPL